MQLSYTLKGWKVWDEVETIDRSTGRLDFVMSSASSKAISRLAGVIVPSTSLISRIFLVGITLHIVTTVTATRQHGSGTGSILGGRLDLIFVIVIAQYILLLGYRWRGSLDCGERALETTFLEPSTATCTSTCCSIPRGRIDYSQSSFCVRFSFSPSGFFRCIGIAR